MSIFSVITQIDSSGKSQKEQYAMTYFSEYLKMSIESGFDIAPRDSGETGFYGWSKKYVWYVAYSLSSAELLFDSFKHDQAWLSSIDTIVCEHKEFIESQVFKKLYLPQYGEQFGRVFLGQGSPNLTRCA